MVPQEDILFCKIAVAHGLVTQEQAKKLLAICNKREQEGKRRPRVGALFSKYNLLKTQEVQRIYEAVDRRLGRAGAAAGSTSILLAPAKKRVAGHRGAARQSEILTRLQRRSARRVSRKTLATGVVFALVFLGVVGGMLAIFIRGREAPVAEPPERASPAVASSTVPAAAEGPEAVPAEAPAQEAASKVMDPGFEKEFRQFLSDGRRCLIDENYAQGVKALTNFRRKNQGRYVLPELEADFTSLVEELEKRAKGAQGEEGGEPGAEEPGEIEGELEIEG